MKWLCNHDWSAWSKLVNAYSDVRQYRTCKKCNKCVSRMALFSNHANTAEFNAGTTKEQKNAPNSN